MWAVAVVLLEEDGLGSSSQLTDSTGTITDRYAYDVFGATRSSSGTTANDFRFTGQQNDQNAQRGLYYLRARSYDPALGRFLQKDPLPFVQRYAYAGGNPANLVDPSGLCPGCGALKHASRAINNGSNAVTQAIGRGAQKAVGFAVDNYCVFGVAGTCAVLHALDTLATRAACAANKESYFDFNFFAGGVGPTFGAQVSCHEGFHPYAGMGAGSANLSFTTGPSQSVINGGSCGAAGAIPFIGLAFGIGGQLGRAGLIDWSSGNAGAGVNYSEIGPGSGTLNASCVYVLPHP